MLNERLENLAKAEGLADVGFLTRHLHTLDFHLGNRSPFADPHARGVVEGLSLDRSLDQDARLYLSAVQAVAYGTRAVIDAMNAAGFSIQTVLATGAAELRTHSGSSSTPTRSASDLYDPARGRKVAESVLLGADAVVYGTHFRSQRQRRARLRRRGHERDGPPRPDHPAEFYRRPAPTTTPSTPSGATSTPPSSATAKPPPLGSCMSVVI